MAGSDHWLWHPAAGKPWMVEKRILRHDGPAAATQIGAEEALTAAPLEPPDLPRVLLRLYCTVDAEQDAETMDEREYALFCVDHAEVLKTYAYKCRLANQHGTRFKELERVPTEEDCVAAQQASEDSRQRCSAAEVLARARRLKAKEASVAGPEVGPPSLDELRAELAREPAQLRRLLSYVGHEPGGQQRLESLAGTPEPPWTLSWSTEHRLWYWHEPLLEVGFNGSTWLRPVPKKVLRKVLKTKLELLLNETEPGSAAAAVAALGKIKTSRELQAGIADPERFLTEGGLPLAAATGSEANAEAAATTGAGASGAEPPLATPASQPAPPSNAAVSVLLGYDYRLLPNEPRAYIAGAEERPLSNPAGLALDRDNNRLFVSEKHRIRAVQLDGVAPAEVIAGYAGTDPTGQVPGFADGEGNAARFCCPSALAYDSVSKRLYVADTGNHAVRALEEVASGKWRVTTIVGTGAPDGFGGPALAYCGRVAVQQPVLEIVEKVKETAVLPLGQKMLLPPEEKMMLSKSRTNGFSWIGLDGSEAESDSPAVEWRAIVQPLHKQESLPGLDGKPTMLPPQVRGSIEATHNGLPCERTLVASEDARRVQDIGPLKPEEVEQPIDVCVEIRCAKGLAGVEDKDGDIRGYAAVVTWGPDAGSLSDDNGSADGSDGLRLLRQRTKRPEPGGLSGYQVEGTECRRWITALAAGPEPMWNESLNIVVPHGQEIEIVVDVWSAAALCTPQALALSPAVSRLGSPRLNEPPELLIGCGDTREAGTAQALAEVGRCDAALSALQEEDARITRWKQKSELTDDERDELELRHAQLRTERKALADRRSTARARSTAANSIRALQLSSGPNAFPGGCTLRSLVRGGEGLLDPCSIVLEPYSSQRRYVVVEGCRQRLVQLLPNGYFRPLAGSRENPSAVCCAPSGGSMYTIDTCPVRRNGGLEELGRLRQAKFLWQWGDEKFSPPRVVWHSFNEEDRAVIEDLHRQYIHGQLGDAHIAQFTMPKDRAADLAAINVFRSAEAYLKRHNKAKATRPVPLEPVLHLMRTYGALKPSERGRLLDFETMRTAIDSTIRRPITQFTRVGTRNSDGGAGIMVGTPISDPIKGKMGGHYSEWVKVMWDDNERDRQVIALIAESRRRANEPDTIEELQSLSATVLRKVAMRSDDAEFRSKLNSIYSASLERSPGADRARRDLVARGAKVRRSQGKATSSGQQQVPDVAASSGKSEPIAKLGLRSPWIETTSLKILMPSESGWHSKHSAALPISTLPAVGEDASTVSPGGSPRSEIGSPRQARGAKVTRGMISSIPSPIERWLLQRIAAGKIPWLEPLSLTRPAFRSFAHSLDARSYQPGKTIIQEGQSGPHAQMPMFIMTTGEAQAIGRIPRPKSLYPSKEVVMEYEEPGSTFGELAMLSSSSQAHYVRAATVTAVKKCTVLVVSRAAFAQFIEPDAACMKCIREQEPIEYWRPYTQLVEAKATTTRKKHKQRAGSRSSSRQMHGRTTNHVEAETAPATAHIANAKTAAKTKAATRMWTTGPGGGGPVMALPSDLNWRELRRSDQCTLGIVSGGDSLPLRDPRAVIALDERTLLVADRWIDGETAQETGAIWKIDLDMLKLAGDLKAEADECLRTKFYKRALDGYTASDVFFARNEEVRSLLIKATGLLRKFGNEPGSGPSPSEDGGEEGEDEDEEGATVG
jgi:CRP-like cAMP-binding protein